MSGAGGWNEIENYGKAKVDWLRSFLTLLAGIPSHDTFNRVFAALDPEELDKGFVAWVHRPLYGNWSARGSVESNRMSHRINSRSVPRELSLIAAPIG